MIYTDKQLLPLLKYGDLITDYDSLSVQLQPSSFDFRLHDSMWIAKSQEGQILDPDETDLEGSGFYEPMPQDEIRGGWLFKPGDFCIGSTQEILNMPLDLVCLVDGRSSLGRLGVLLHVTAGFIDPGFKGRVTLEIKNLSPHTILLKPGMRVGQFIFMSCKSACEVGYRGRYVDQDVPTLSRFSK